MRAVLPITYLVNSDGKGTKRVILANTSSNAHVYFQKIHTTIFQESSQRILNV